MTQVIKLAGVRPAGAEPMAAHPAADIFPPMSGAEFDALVADIRENGQRDAIVVHDGRILDGRHRYRACQQAGVVPRFAPWDQHGTAEAFVVSVNLHRRHLNESQRAMIGARIANMEPGNGPAQRRDAEISASQKEAAALLNVHRDTISAARMVLNKGTPEEVAAVERGEASVHTIASEIRNGSSPAKRKAKRDEPLRQVGGNPKRIQRLKMYADVWAKVGGALDALTALPLPSDVAEIVASHPKRRLHASEKIGRALQWLDDFAKAYDARMRERSQSNASDRD